jgi:hypothetical protein
MWDDNKTLGMSKRWHSVTLPPAFVGNQNMNMGNKMEKRNWQNRWMGGMAMGKCKNRQIKSCITKTNYKHSKGGYGWLPLGNVYTCHGFFKTMHKFEETNSKTSFHKFSQWFVHKGFNNHWKPAINKIFETLKTILCNFKQVNLVATWFFLKKI